MVGTERSLEGLGVVTGIESTLTGDGSHHQNRIIKARALHNTKSKEIEEARIIVHHFLRPLKVP